MSIFSSNTRQRGYYDLVINSKNRENYLTTNSNNYVIVISNPIDAQITRYGLRNAIIPMTGYNITSSFQITDSGGLKTVSITPGNYTSATILPALQAALTAVSLDTYVASFLENKIRIVSSFTDFVINPNNLVGNSTLSVLGFTGNLAYTSGTGILIGYSNINLAYPLQLFIHIKQLRKSIRTTNGKYHNFVVNTGCEFGGIVYHNSQNTFIQEFPPFGLNAPPILSTMDVSLRTEDGELYDLQGSDWSFIMNLEYLTNV